jgi:hypothetical protein
MLSPPPTSDDDIAGHYHKTWMGLSSGIFRRKERPPPPAVNYAAFDVRRINGVQIISFALSTKPTLGARSQQRN